MSIEPFMWATFCDDVRQEVGNKVSYMGIYGSNLIVAKLPATLVRICCVLNVRVPATSPPKHVVFRIFRDEELIFENLMSAIENATLADMAAEDISNRHITIGTVAQLTNFQLTQRCFLRTRVLVDGKELRGGALELLGAEVTH